MKKYRDTSQKLAAVVNYLNSEASSGAIIVVEGERDEDAVRSLGYTGEIYKLCSNGKSYMGLLNASETHTKTILLLDYDRKGRYMLSRSIKILQSKGISVDIWVRKKIREITKGGIGHIEELSHFCPDSS
ncbi:MAG: hypothetical protein QXR69_01640 [Conexivisphaerales archaeon]